MITTNAAGNDEWIGIDDISVTSSALAAPQPGNFSINDVTVAEGGVGASTDMVFTVLRSGGSTGEVTLDYAIALPGTNGKAALNDFVGGTLTSGKLTFADGVLSQTVTVKVAGDAANEPNETFTVTLAAPSKGGLSDAVGIGTISNDDAGPLHVYDIQGLGHASGYTGQVVTTSGVVTAVDTNGFYLQDPVGDGDIGTSDGIFVFTSTAPTVKSGDSIDITGTVTEFKGNTAGSLSLTELTAPVVKILSSGNALPAPVLISTDGGGRAPPTSVIDDDSFGSFDPATDGIDFWESLEGMRVTLKAPLVVADTNSFGETYAVVSGGAGATGLNSRNGMTISAGDLNPETIQIDDDSGVFAGYAPAHTQGDLLGDVTGVLNYAFAEYEVVVTQAVSVTSNITQARETTSLVGDAYRLSYVSFNVENLSPLNAPIKYTTLATEVVNALRTPDIIGLQEIQDNDGNGTGADLTGSLTAQKLIDAIVAAGGPAYTYIEVAPASTNISGGEPNGNIRNGYLYNAARVQYVGGTATVLSDAAFNGSRKPIVADFTFNGQTFTAIDVHSTSRGGSDPLFGDNQPPVAAGDTARTSQATAIRNYINGVLGGDPTHKFIVNGDFNGYAFEPAIQALTAGGVMVDLYGKLPAEERYSYFFDGYYHTFDFVLVSSALSAGASFDVVHYNAGFADGVSVTDHDQPVALITLASTTPTAFNDLLDVSQIADVVINGGAGNDAFSFGAAFTSADKVDGGAGNNDQIGLKGDYSGGLTLAADTITGIEVIAVLPGFDYSLKTVDGNVAAGQQLAIFAGGLGAADDLTFDGAAETDGYFTTFGGQGADRLTGGAKNDGFYFGPARFGGTDTVNGGAGNNDQLGLDGDYTLTLDRNITNIEVVVMIQKPNTPLNTYNLSTTDAFVSSGQTMTIYGVQVVNSITFNGSAETSGAFRVFGGLGADIITTGAGNDWILAGAGADLLTGGDGADTFVYEAAGESASSGFDTLLGFNFAADLIDLPGDHNEYLFDTSGRLDAATFDADIAAQMAGLTAGRAIFFTPDSGSFNGQTFLIVDGDGVAGYQAASDYVFKFDVAPPVGPPPDFII